MTLRFESEHWRVVDAVGFVRAERTEIAYRDGAECLVGLARLEVALHGAPTNALLIDARRGKGTQDPDIERAIMHFNTSVLERFTRVAALVQTSVGLLQSQRLLRSQATAIRPFDDERAAIAYLVAPSVKDTRSGSTRGFSRGD